MNSELTKIAGYVGRYSGIGTNHHGENFVGEFSLVPLMEDQCFQIRFIALSNDTDARVFHQEISTLANNVAGRLVIVSYSSNSPFLMEHVLVSMEESRNKQRMIFRFGDLQDIESFREELCLDLMSNGGIGYHYSWGLPGSEFGYRSGVMMSRVDEAQLCCAPQI
jgi:hypothetical protein